MKTKNLILSLLLIAGWSNLMGAPVTLKEMVRHAQSRQLNYKEIPADLFRLHQPDCYGLFPDSHSFIPSKQIISYSDLLASNKAGNPGKIAAYVFGGVSATALILCVFNFGVSWYNYANPGPFDPEKPMVDLDVPIFTGLSIISGVIAISTGIIADKLYMKAKRKDQGFASIFNSLPEQHPNGITLMPSFSAQSLGVCITF